MLSAMKEDWQIGEGVQVTEDGDSLLLLSPDGYYYGLDDIGVRIWRALENGNLDDILQDIEAHYRVTPQVFQSDVTSLLTALQDAKLIAQSKHGKQAENDSR